MRNLLRQLALAIPPIGALYRQRNALLEANALLVGDADRLREQLAASEQLRQQEHVRQQEDVRPQQNPERQSEAVSSEEQRLAARTIKQMAFSVWDQSIDCLKDDRFLQAYNFGAASGHKYGVLPPQEWKFYIACCLATHAKNLDGDFVECGVNTGMISRTICKYIDFNSTGKKFFLFDTYQGIPEEQMSDFERSYALDMNKHWYPEVYELAKKNFEPFPMAQLIRGAVPDSLPQAKIEKVCYLHLDMNIAAPEIGAIKFFWDKLAAGAVVLLDDYNWEVHIAQKKAMDAFAAQIGTMVIPLPTTQGILIKPS